MNWPSSGRRGAIVSRTLTLQTLIDEHACPSQAELFDNTFGDSVEVTPELCLSVADKFDWDWAALHLLSSVAQADYVRAKATAQADYDRATAPAQADYFRATALASGKCYTARADYDRAKATAWADYVRATAFAFGKCYAEGSQP